MEFLFQDEQKCQQPGLFVEEGIDEEVWSIREALDSDTEFSPHCAHSVIEVSVIVFRFSSRKEGGTREKVSRIAIQFLGMKFPEQ